ncbi:MAG: hypothetical protein LUG16_08110 [Candidatus Gastranaerophilales bacterium]|nr:hypothetical protein [Candidatus Gastranaerophilales bacterium]
MEISGSSYNQPVSFYTKNTGNNINTAIDTEKYSFTSNVFASDISHKEKIKSENIISKKRRKNKRLNTIDTDYLPDEITEDNIDENNFFIEKNHQALNGMKKVVKTIVESTPLINYFFLKKKQRKIANTVKTLNDISQNVDELMNSTAPYGEESELYQDIAKNLTNAAMVIGKSNKEINIQ